jgi:translation initiation factor 2 beta subunit (eIF-2beta)/eIF-5
MGKLKIKKEIEEYIEYVPCIKCGSEDLKFWNCGYSSFNVGGVTCNNCKNEVQTKGIDWNAPDSDLIPRWNENNDPKILIEKYQKGINTLQRKIDRLQNGQFEEKSPVQEKIDQYRKTREGLCYCGQPIDYSNPDCVEFSLCRGHQMES